MVSFPSGFLSCDVFLFPCSSVTDISSAGRESRQLLHCQAVAGMPSPAISCSAFNGLCYVIPGYGYENLVDSGVAGGRKVHHHGAAHGCAAWEAVGCAHWQCFYDHGKCTRTAATGRRNTSYPIASLIGVTVNPGVPSDARGRCNLKDLRELLRGRGARIEAAKERGRRRHRLRSGQIEGRRNRLVRAHRHGASAGSRAGAGPSGKRGAGSRVCR